MERARIVVAEDEPSLREAISRALTGAGYEVKAFADGSDVEGMAAFRPDLAMLDIMMPVRDGLAVAADLRARSDLPVLFLTAKDAVADRLAGFDAGADDYIVKPVTLAEVLARVKAVLRRAGKLHSDTVAVGDLLIDEGAARVSRDGVEIELTPTEFRLVSYLAHNRGRALSKLQILTQVWGYDAYDPNLVEVHISQIRRKIEGDDQPKLIHTVRGIGYRMEAR